MICSAGFRTGDIRNVPQSEKFAVEREYGMPARLYGHTIEIDHIVPLELGGSNAAANLFPEPGSGPASYHVKDRLENRLHDLVCAGRLSLAAARRGIAADWEALYLRAFGVPA
ncbi:MAG TPA: HNH endonuclease signature motif containing protein [Gaiellaceae bacterium]|nr:HNH endonuclease signature motif containing protein [Gaiellaceae bacterium]